MLAAGLLHALRGARQRGLSSRAVAAAAAAAWRLLKPAETGLPAGSFSGRLVSSHGDSSSFSSAVSGGEAARNVGISGGGSGTGSGPPKRGRGKPSNTVDPQPQLQAWLQQQGLPAAEADQHARRLAHIFGSQQAALAGLPATFEWCRSRGLTGLQTAQLLDCIAKRKQESVVQFAALVQPAWQLIDSYIAAHVEPLRQAGARLPTHTSLAEVLCSSKAAAAALAMPPGHVEAWLAAVSQQLPAAGIGRLLLSNLVVVTGSPATAVAALDWAADVLGVTDPTAFFTRAAILLSREVSALQRNLDSLQQALGCTAEQAQQLAVKRPRILSSDPATVQAALAWLRQLFPDAEQLAGVINRGPHLLSCSVQHLQGNADYLRQALGWQDGNSQLAAFITAHPQDFATVNLNSEETEHRLRLMSSVVGVSRQQCLSSGIGYLNRRLENVAARYMLVQARVPQLLYSRNGSPSLSWIITALEVHNLRRLGMTRPQFNAFVRQWPCSEEGRRLLEGLRAGRVECWPRPPVWEEAQQQLLHAGKAEVVAAKRQGRGRPRKTAA